jgi:hypothetical protein
MNNAQAHEQAKAQSLKTGPTYVVWVFDHGQAVYSSEQARRWSKLIRVEALYVGGVLIATEGKSQQILALKW